MSDRDAYLRRTYGMTERQYNALLKKQGGKCAVCEREASTYPRNFDVDHDHTTMFVRGLLCRYCNHKVVGRHRDPWLLAQAAKYLRRKQTKYVVPKRARRRKRREEER